jgi:hypothetical protein
MQICLSESSLLILLSGCVLASQSTAMDSGEIIRSPGGHFQSTYQECRIFTEVSIVEDLRNLFKKLSAIPKDMLTSRNSEPAGRSAVACME